MPRSSWLATAAIAAALAPALVAAADPPLGQYKVDPSKVTVGGLSSGAFMAVQMHVAYSATFKGAAVWAGGPYYCAMGSESTAITTCMNPLLSKPNAGELAAATSLAASKGQIDPTSNLKSSPAWVYSGTDDTIVHRPVVQSLVDYYNLFNVSVATQFTTPSEHCFPTLNYGEACSQKSSPYIGKCLYDSAGDAFKKMYGASAVTRGSYNIFNRASFDQTPFAGGNPSGLSLESTGYVYVPSACKNNSVAGGCGVHMNFHGCQQTLEDIQTTYVDNVGLSEWGEGSNTIIVYPQAKKSLFSPSNPEGCWDWWGYTDASTYVLKDGPQMKFSKAILDHLSGGATA